MARYYASIAGSSLRERLRELEKDSPEERYSLSEELDMSRIMAGQALKMYEAAFEASDKKPTNETKALVLQTLKSSLKFVNDTALAASKVHQISNSTVDVEQLDYIVRQVTEVIEQEITDEATVDRVAKRLLDIKMPERVNNSEISDIKDLAQKMRDAANAIEDSVDGPES